MQPALTRFAGRSRLVRAAVAAAVVLALLLWWQPGGSNPAPQGTVSFTTGVHTGVYERYGKLLRNSLHKDLPGVDVRLQRSEGSVQNIERLVSGEAGFTIATADAVADHLARGGAGANRLQACARLYDDYMQLVVPRDSPVHKASDLRGKRVAVGQPGSGVSLIAGRLLKAAGIDPDTGIEPVRVGIDTMPDLLRQGKIDAFFWSGGLPTGAVSALAETVDVRLVPLGDLIGALQDESSATRHYRAAVMPADAYPQIQDGKPVKTVAVANLLVTTDRVDPALAERVTRTVIDSRDRIGRKVHAAQLVDLRTAIYTDPLELHEGARRYYRSVKS
ncbi:TAXI family TRAP transporter solute-binding subunit [Streptomyces meridianus]|uniref:TAXI family TRAP transporter solute-binding subunit n=1 Tax=Streptomyces meridianus TaxID=2938945 RepID=A0ABT0X8E4_9ACTN|nr:TAXI family TRAP transporter solute-binding subunit [Streptomyces meridianus]MCM2578801.1 TAXI family TRAP transporter solute-binding subunit [Streptomyces meridianus]